MEQIIVIKPNATTVKLGGTSPYCVVTKAEQNMALMGEDTVDIELISEGTISVGIGDSIIAFGRKYTLLDMPSIERESFTRYKYSLSFKGPVHSMQKAIYKMESALGTNATGDFSLMADLSKFVDLLITNMNEFGGSWVKGLIPATNTKNLTFVNENCQSVISKLADEFALEYKINYVDSEWEIDFAERIGRDLPDVLSYAKGIRNLKRRFISEESFTTKLFAFGSTNNLPSNYRNYSPRLKMPVNLAGDYEPPTAPQNLTVEAVLQELPLLDSAHLEWSASSDNIGVAKYLVYISFSGNNFYVIDETTDTFSDLPAMPTNEDIRFKVKAVDAAGNKSRASNTVSLFIADNLIPPVLVDLEAIDDGVNVIWNEPTSEYEAVEIWRGLNDGPFILRSTRNKPATNYEDMTAITPGRRYTYKLRSLKLGFSSAFSSPLTIEF